jgi:uncharacterized protein YdhG (YjbR/CyaY superfamily)
MKDVKFEPWVDEMLAEHRELHKSIDEVRAFLAEPRPEVGTKGSHTWAAKLSQYLVALHDQLFRHFRAEEQDGMMRDLAERFPRAWKRVEHMVGEHATILAEMRGLMNSAMEYAEGISPSDPRLRQQLTSVLDELKAHEEAEIDLLQRMYYNDIGTGD